MTKQHARLSASGSSRWINCPGSIKLSEQYENKSSVYSDEGTIAHEVADRCLKTGKQASKFVGKTLKQLKIDVTNFDNSHAISIEMADNVQEYVDYVISHQSENSLLFTEERVDFSNFIPGGFGTCDSAVLDLDTEVCHIFDLKYGKGVKVDAFENTQAQLYAIGFYNSLSFLNTIKSFRLHVCQPRIDNYSYWDINLNDLVKFASYASQRAQLALSDNPPITPGDKQCVFCPAKADCKELYKLTQNCITKEFDELDEDDIASEINTLTEDERKLIVDNKDLILSFIKEVEKKAFSKLLSGDKFPGYKLVEGRSNRIWKDDALDVLTDQLGDGAYTKKLIGITDAESKLGKKVVSQLTLKPKGKLTMVKLTDKRKAYDFGSECASDFEKLDS